MKTCVLLSLISIGCSTTQSSAGRFVSSISLSQDELVVTRCEMQYTVEDRTGVAIVLFPLLLLAALGGGGGGGGADFSSWEIAARDCAKTVTAMPKAGDR